MDALTTSQKISLGTKEIAKRIRTQLKQEFSKNKFSVRSEYYSMGSSITVSLMNTNIKVINPNNGDLQTKKYCQLNEYQLKDEYDSQRKCNGTYLTKEGHDLLKRVVEIVNQYNYNHSDAMTDYYSVNFSFDLELGKWDKPMIEPN